jgi:two-component system, LytTR family, response regulator
VTQTTKAFTVLIADDEAPARHLLAEYLKHASGYVLVGEAQNGREAIEQATLKTPDLLLLDVDMPGLDGFEVLPFLPRETRVVFVTAYDAFALRAFDVHAVDYLLKPVSFERFGEALRRAKERLAPSSLSSTHELRQAARPPNTYLERIVIKDGARIEIVMTSEVECFEAQDDYVEVHFRGRSSLAPETLTSLENSLNPEQFVRVHRSFIVHLTFLDRIQTLSQGKKVAVLRSGREVPVSRAGDTRLRAHLRT